MHKPVLVIKLGTAVITGADGKADEMIISRLAEEIAELNTTYKVVLVSSGAVGSGKSFIKNYKGTLIERKAAAAVGNPILIQLYHKHFSMHNLVVAQALCERHHFSNRSQFLQLKETFYEFWENNIIPVVNENDLVSNVELKFSDNDELSTLIAIGFDAETLVICTSVGGFLDDNKAIIRSVENIDNTILGYVNSEKSAVGLGGMVSKLTFTRLATSLGIQVIMTGLNQENALKESMAGNSGTIFKPKKSNLKARQKWLASGSITLGSLLVDKGAEKALHERKSLLTVGVKDVKGIFSAGEVVQLINEEETIIGVAKVKLDAAQMAEQVSKKHALAAHCDDIVLF
ncbi:glutamate 5-kinase [Segetibacter aerophilus]|uniref:Glutamate 5-kinase n=1 Tax=Segetibacter aerophilus TaxID=670293 RepID=A0A512BG20_9BACT|nr:glutamate 5-kinase [Segetibacter aerophilus]GEO10903.1 glutamate 5-kinase [Segetibacter aerophilus]